MPLNAITWIGATVLLTISSGFCEIAAADGEPTVNDLESWKPPAELSKRMVYYLSGFDEENRPIWIGEVGKWDVRDILDAGGDNISLMEKYIDQALYRYNQSISLRSTPERPVTEGCVILDLDGYSLSQITHLKTISFVIRRAADVAIAAKTMSKGVMLNLDAISQRLLELLTPILGAAMKNTELFGTNNATWIPKMLKLFPKESLPPFYGGYPNHKPVAVYG